MKKSFFLLLALVLFTSSACQAQEKTNEPTNVYVITNAVPDPENDKARLEYAQTLGPLFKKFGATNFKILKVESMIYGSRGPHITTIFEFPDQESVKKAFSSEEYNKIVPLRDKAFKKVEVIVYSDLNLPTSR